MRWYCARIVNQCFIDGKPSRGSKYLFDECITVIRARNPEVAYKQALKYGRLHQAKYKNDQGETVEWKFCGLLDLEEIIGKSIRSGTEISSALRVADSKEDMVVKKRELTVFWSERNKNRRAFEILEE